MLYESSLFSTSISIFGYNSLQEFLISITDTVRVSQPVPVDAIHTKHGMSHEPHNDEIWTRKTQSNKDCSLQRISLQFTERTQNKYLVKYTRMTRNHSTILYSRQKTISFRLILLKCYITFRTP